MRSLVHSLRTSVTRWFAGTIALGLLVLGAAVLLVAGLSSVRSEQDRELAAGAERVIASWLAARADPASAQAHALPLPDDGAGFCALRAPGGQVLEQQNVHAAERLPPLSGAAGDGPLLPVFVTLDAPDALALTGKEVSLRAVTVPFRARDELRFLQLGARERHWSRSLAVWSSLLVLGALALVLLSRLAAGRIVGRLLSPLRALIEVAGEVSPSQPGKRFRVADNAIELRRLEEELNAALLRMEEGLRSQAQFASNVAHELKTPIAALMAEAQVSRIGRRDLAKSYAFMDRAEEELRHLSELVESFLVLARVDAHDERWDLVFVDDVVRRALGRCARAAAKRGVELVLSLAEASPTCDPFVRGDAQLLQATVENLVRNALQHSPRGEAVRVSTRCAADEVSIVVDDRGPGIPAELRQVVFERGVRAAVPDLKPGGSGLGLSIVTNVVQLHGGKVTVEENDVGGCSFVVTLTTARARTERAC